MRPPFKKRPESTPLSAFKSPSQNQLSRTEEIAYGLYQTRQLLNRPGDHTTDWVIAERIVQSRLRLALYRFHRPFIGLEKNTWEPLLAWANNQALLSLLGLVGNIGLIIAVATYIGSEKQRRNAEVLNAWQTITNAHGQAGSGGRIQALEFLNASPGANWRRKFPWVCAPSSICLWNAESLAGINLSIEGSDNIVEDNLSEFPRKSSFVVRNQGVFLQNIQLPRADLSWSNLEGAVLDNANLEGVYLGGANLKGAHLGGANLKEAHLQDSNLEGADFLVTDLGGADLGGANLKRASMVYAQLKEADLEGANLEEARLENANLEGAHFRQANLEGANLKGANLEGTDFFGSNLKGADLEYVNLKGGGLWFANLEGARLENANLEGVHFGNANLEVEGPMSMLANLEGVHFGNANLEGAVGLSTGQLTQAKLCNTQLPAHIDLPPDRDCEELGISIDP